MGEVPLYSNAGSATQWDATLVLCACEPQTTPSAV